MSGTVRARRKKPRFMTEPWFDAIRQMRNVARAQGDRKMTHRMNVAMGLGMTIYFVGETAAIPVRGAAERFGGHVRYLASVIAV